MSTHTLTNHTYIPINDPQKQPFRLALGCSLPNIYDISLTAALARKLACHTYEDIDTNPAIFGLPELKQKPPEAQRGDHPYWLPPVSNSNNSFVEWWDSYIWRAILTAHDQGGIYFNLAKFSKIRIEIALQRYAALISSTNREIILFAEYSKTPWSSKECKHVWPNLTTTRWPTYTEWELAFIFHIVGYDNTKFFNVCMEKDLEELSEINGEQLFMEYGIANYSRLQSIYDRRYQIHALGGQNEPNKACV